MKFGLPLIFLFFLISFNPAYGQGLNCMSNEVLVKNKVKKIFEYDALDSLNFMKEHPNGSYNAYNEDGQRIEYNWYSMKEDENGNQLFEECKTYQLYDYSSGELIGSVSINPTSEESIYSIDLEERDEKTGIVKSVELGNGYGGAYISFDEKMQENNDTIQVSKFHKRIYWNEDSSYIEDIYLNSFLLIDSTILTFETYPVTKGAGPKDTSKSRIKSVYTIQNGLNLRIKCEFSEEPYTQLDQIWQMEYLENGLLESVYHNSFKNKKKKQTRYIYVYRS